jgi:DNA polymerase III sliding clamp (beta) subunit (PCNA family)
MFRYASPQNRANLKLMQETQQLRQEIESLKLKVIHIEDEVAQNQFGQNLVIGLGIGYLLILSIGWLARPPS